MRRTAVLADNVCSSRTPMPEIVISLDDYEYLKPYISDMNVYAALFEKVIILIWDSYDLKICQQILTTRGPLKEKNIWYFIN